MTKVLDLPIPASGCGDIRIIADSADLIAEFEYYSKDKKDMIGQIIFRDLNAFGFKDEKHILNYESGAYDSVIVIDNSEGIKLLQDVEPVGVTGIENKKHYAVFFSSNGYLEVIASSCELGKPREGHLPGFP
ncbi:MAG: hypothetical protein KZQ99_22295 [Candidatus Thiodiazotropha sp. (ex Dulcina madagascariensis)]|nr:hypothetical protein [Candidatus Thiodiazotropha sp. (ex Dulcina madagascariensis)]